MHTSTTIRRGLLLTLLMLVFAGSAVAQRTVTLTLNAASIPDTIKTDSFFEVRGAVDTDGDGSFESPHTFTDGNVIDWNDSSTLEPVNIGGDYWQVQFQMATDVDLQFKFFSQQAEDADGFNGWEADPNPIIEAGSDDIVMPVHFFEEQG
ncbi:MAG: hypothetical protein HKN17_09095, partial [Rhodothermales bacterium]|nr:hypothetical protein [Rhodothermales bacterium]